VRRKFLDAAGTSLLIFHKMKGRHGSCFQYGIQKAPQAGGIMPRVNIDKVGEMAIIECAGRFVGSEAAFKLRDAVKSQTDASVVVLDLTEMHAIGGGNLGMLVLLQSWAEERDIRFQLFNPPRPVQDKLKHVDFEIATLE
jgi:anti-anti-sigma regulatory factor